VPDADLDHLIDRAIAEDVGSGDLTTSAIVTDARPATAQFVVHGEGVVCGLAEAFAVVRRLDRDARMDVRVRDGERISEPPIAVAAITASARALLTAERTALNLLGRMGGIATATRRYVDAVAGSGVAVLDTRKTAPGMRALDKRAVRCGGGANHRAGLWDAVLIKDNHLAVAGGVAEAVRRVRARHDGVAVEVEADTLEHVEQALAAGVDWILLDNMAPDQLREAVALAGAHAAREGRRPRLEASGGITLATVRDVARTGVDAVSVGALTHSVEALDVSLEVTL
jgi:nicotinate-nucleotide pyrophosphorylase (carboxylating)